MELLDLLFEQADDISIPEEPEGGCVKPAWPFPDQSVSIVACDICIMRMFTDFLLDEAQAKLACGDLALFDLPVHFPLNMCKVRSFFKQKRGLHLDS